LREIERLKNRKVIALSSAERVVSDSCFRRGLRNVCNVDKMVQSVLQMMVRNNDGKRVVCLDGDVLNRNRSTGIVNRLKENGIDAGFTERVFVPGVSNPVCIYLDDLDYEKAKRVFNISDVN